MQLCIHRVGNNEIEGEFTLYQKWFLNNSLKFRENYRNLSFMYTRENGVPTVIACDYRNCRVAINFSRGNQETC